MWPWLDDIRQDVRYALRGFARTPAFTAVAVLTLTLGIGANTGIFSVVNTILLQPLPYPDADRLVHLVRRESADESPTGQARRVPISLNAAELADLRSRTTALSHVGVSSFAFMTVTGINETTRLQGAWVSAAILEMRGVPPLIGRLFDAGDEQPGADGVVIISEETWRRDFGGHPDILARTLTLDDAWARAHGRARDIEWPKTFAVVGVMPGAFEPPDAGGRPRGREQFWIPGSEGVLSARLADGVSAEAAAAEVGAIVDGLQPEGTDRPRATAGGPPRYELVRDHDALVAPVKPALLVLMAAVVFVLLIACANVANLLLVRAAARQRELAIRAALGAGRARMIRLLLSESVMLALVGAAGGIVLAVAGIRLLRALAPSLSRLDLGHEVAIPRLEAISLDASVLVFTVATAIVTGVLCGAAPAVGHARIGSLDALRESATTAYGGLVGAARQRTRGLLVMVEIAMATVLLLGGGLMIHSFAKLSRVDAGYDPTNVLTFQVALPGERYPTPRLKAFAEDLVARLQSLPAVEAAAYARQLPMVTLKDSFAFRRAATAAVPSGQEAPDTRIVSRGYLEAMGMRVVAGRGFSDQDGAGSPRALIVNQALADRDFHGEDPLGLLVYTGPDDVPWEIVGVVNDVRQLGLDVAPTPQYFVDVRQWPDDGFTLFPLAPYYAVRTASGTSVLPAVRRIVRELDAEAGVYNVATMDEIVSSSIARPRTYAVLLGILASVAVALAAVGVYGMLAYVVVQRTREIGIRMALGARRVDVMHLVVGQSLRLTVAGITVGLAGAAVLTRSLEGMLYGLTPLDPATYVAVSVLFGAVATLAASIPAGRATRVDPSVALRND